MVDVRPNACLLVLLSALVLAAPCASAGVIGRARDHVDDVAKVTGLPNVPLLDRIPDDDVKWTIHDDGIEAQGAGVEMGASCTASAGTQSGCGGYVCFMDPGSGTLPVSLGDWGRGMFGVGIDLAALQDGVPIVIHHGQDPQPDGAGAQDAEGDGGSYGPYDGVFVNPTGHCGP